jgi:hypothetical protein
MSADRRLTYCLVLAAVFAVCVYAKSALKAGIENTFDDFGHYWLSAALVTEGYDVWDWDASVEQRNLELATEQGIAPTITPYHSLGFFLLMRPFLSLPCRQAALWWFLAGHLLFFCALWIMLGKLRPARDAPDILFLLFLFFSFWPLREQLHQMQPNFIVLFLLTVSLYWYTVKRFLLAGLMLGIAFNVREYMAAALIVFMLGRQWRVLLGAAAGFLALKLAAVCLFGWEREVSYWKFMVRFFGVETHAGIANESLPAFVRRVASGSLGAAGSSLLALLAAGSLLIQGCRRALNAGEYAAGAYCAFLVVPFLVSPWVHESHFVALYPAIAYVWGRLTERDNDALYAVFIAAYLLMGIGYSLSRFPLFHAGLPALLTGGKVTGVLLLYLLTLQVNAPNHASGQS